MRIWFWLLAGCVQPHLIFSWKKCLWQSAWWSQQSFAGWLLDWPLVTRTTEWIRMSTYELFVWSKCELDQIHYRFSCHEIDITLPKWSVGRDGLPVQSSDPAGRVAHASRKNHSPADRGTKISSADKDEDVRMYSGRRSESTVVEHLCTSLGTITQDRK